MFCKCACFARKAAKLSFLCHNSMPFYSKRFSNLIQSNSFLVEVGSCTHGVWFWFCLFQESLFQKLILGILRVAQSAGSTDTTRQRWLEMCYLGQRQVLPINQTMWVGGSVGTEPVLLSLFVVLCNSTLFPFPKKRIVEVGNFHFVQTKTLFLVAQVGLLVSQVSRNFLPLLS